MHVRRHPGVVAVDAPALARCAGPALDAAPGCFRRPKRTCQKTRRDWGLGSRDWRHLVLAPNWLGDAMMALPAIRDVRRHFSAAAALRCRTARGCAGVPRCARHRSHDRARTRQGIVAAWRRHRHPASELVSIGVDPQAVRCQRALGLSQRFPAAAADAIGGQATRARQFSRVLFRSGSTAWHRDRSADGAVAGAGRGERGGGGAASSSAGGSRASRLWESRRARRSAMPSAGCRSGLPSWRRC